MKRMNLIALFSPDEKQALFCLREKEPYRGLLNFVGGKLEPEEDGLSGAYRELQEESGVTPDDITLTHLMDFTYYMEDAIMEVYYGRLRHPVVLREELNHLIWLDVAQDYADTTRFAGCGNLGHIISLIQMYKNRQSL